MPEQVTPEAPTRRGRKAITAVAAALVGAACVAGIVYVIVSHLGSMTPAKSDVILGRRNTDPSFSVFRSTMRRRTALLSARFAHARSRIGSSLPATDSLMTACESGFVRLRGQLARLESLDIPERSGFADTIRMTYASLREAVTAVVRVAAAEAGPGPDSLDAEFRKLISE